MKKKGLTKNVVLVLSPLNITQEEQLNILGSSGVTSCRLPYSDKEPEFDLDLSKNLENSVIFAHPEALLNTDCRKSLLQDRAFIDAVAAVTIDECHIVGEWQETNNFWADLTRLTVWDQH
ncbi:uncharacterized protein LOC132743457 [Ruditapes philippinarum]|uniref:uncharacterized protein LOC132743457 n=1 Tax=Ruditapes philippinarum TaxID=129788 RepID=UPI00295C1AAA|nr:uncharacterized protein LOC132743457 [Ruditapes philippinarum]